MRLNIGQVLYYLMPYFNKKQCDEFIFQCPFCMDTGRDNLKFNERKGVLHCFANPEHSKMIYKKIMSNPKLRRLSQPTQYEYQDDRNSLSYEEQIGYMLGFDTCNDYLLENEELLNSLYLKRGINKETVYNMNIGFEPHLNKWVFPNYGYRTNAGMEILGYELRPKDFSKKGLCRSKGTPNNLSAVNRYTKDTEILCVVEGFLDAYSLWQHLNEHGQSSKYHIVTPTNGINSLPKHIDRIEFEKYKKHYLFVDNDEVSRPIADKICAKYPFENIRLTCGCKDFNEHYLRCIKPKQQGNEYYLI